MASCSYCHQQATANIPATPGRVCVTHAIEFWTAFLAFAKEARQDAETPEDPCPSLTVPRLRAKRTGGRGSARRGESARHEAPAYRELAHR
jgi:hypothetical protein